MDTAKIRKLDDKAVKLYLKSQAKIEEEELNNKLKAIRFFKGKLSKEEMLEY